MVVAQPNWTLSLFSLLVVLPPVSANTAAAGAAASLAADAEPFVLCLLHLLSTEVDSATQDTLDILPLGWVPLEPVWKLVIFTLSQTPTAVSCSSCQRVCCFVIWHLMEEAGCWLVEGASGKVMANDSRTSIQMYAPCYYMHFTCQLGRK